MLKKVQEEVEEATKVRDALLGKKEKFLGATEDLDSINEKIKAGKGILVDLERRAEEVASLENKKKTLQKDIVTAQGVIDGKEDQLKSIEIEIQKSQLEHGSLLETITSIEKNIASLEEEVTRLMATATSRNQEVLEAEQKIRDLDVQLKNSEKIQALYKETIEKFNNELNSLKEDSKKIAENNERALVRSEDNKKKLEEEIALMRSKAEEQVASKLLAFQKREGELSVKEGILNEKTLQLRSIKNDLEKFYNRPFSLII